MSDRPLLEIKNLHKNFGKDVMRKVIYTRRNIVVNTVLDVRDS